MEGLEIKEKSFLFALENKDFRVDSQFYTKEPYKNPTLKYSKIGSLLKKAQYGISISMNDEKIGYPIYRMNEIHNGLCDSEVSKYAEITQNELETFTLNDRDVLFNRTNSFEWVGRTGLYKKVDSRNYIFASYLVRFIPNKTYLLPEYLTAFLNTKYGIWDIKRRARQSINQTNVNPEEVKEIEIPLFSFAFQKQLEELYNVSNQKRIQSQQIYSDAESLLLESLDLKNFEPSNEPVNIKNLKKSFLVSGRLDAEYYQRKYDELEELLLSSTGGADYFENLVEYIKTGEYSSNYLPKNDETNFYIRNTNFRNCLVVPDPNYSVNPEYFSTSAKEGEILTSRVGTMGLFGVITKEFEGSVYSDNILCFKLKKHLNPFVYSLLFSSKMYHPLIEKIAGGSVQPLITQTTLKKLIIPIIGEKEQQQTSELIEKSFCLKKQSEQLLDLAKTAVEKAIEENEEAAMGFINLELEKLSITG